MVELVSLEGNVLKVKGLDATNGPPVWDLKPYFPAFDLVTDAIVPEWMPRLMEGYV